MSNSGTGGTTTETSRYSASSPPKRTASSRIASARGEPSSGTRIRLISASGMHFDPESNVVDVHVGNVRRKLQKATGENLIQTVRGVGFCLRHAGSNGAGQGGSLP